MQGSAAESGGYVEILREPDSVTGFLELKEPVELHRAEGAWSGGGMRVRTEAQRDQLLISLAAPNARPTHVRVRWNAAVDESVLVLGDAWERSYGDLHWSSLVPERAMPWYFLAAYRGVLHGYGVKTGAGAFCFWQIDPAGVSLWLNVCNGGSGVVLGDRVLHAATVVARRGDRGEGLLDAVRGLCRTMCEAPRAKTIFYGSNDWYYAYGKNSAAGIERDAELMASLAPSGGPRPFTVIDDGWKNKAAYPDMAALAAAIRSHGVRPGLWIRPLEAPGDAPAALLLSDARYGWRGNRKSGRAWDPTIPEAMERVLAKVTEATGWGYELVKHDFTTYDLLGQWGFEMKAEPTFPGWNLHDASQTNAEVIREMYAAIRRAAGEKTLVIGCNTVGHLGAGIFDAQRTGDDVSGKEWERTRRMGVNTLAYRLPQHGAFFALDADCVPITQETPWACNRQWLDLLARSGTVLLVSPEPAATGEEQRQALREAFAIAAAGGADAMATDWQSNTTPDRWRFGGVEKSYDWYEKPGVWPFELS